jgi:hypothetical protein
MSVRDTGPQKPHGRYPLSWLIVVVPIVQAAHSLSRQPRSGKSREAAARDLLPVPPNRDRPWPKPFAFLPMQPFAAGEQSFPAGRRRVMLMSRFECDRTPEQPNLPGHARRLSLAVRRLRQNASDRSGVPSSVTLQARARPWELSSFCRPLRRVFPCGVGETCLEMPHEPFESTG